MQPILDKEKDNLFGAFVSQLRTSDFSENTISPIYSLLYTKMTNLRKKDMERSMERIRSHETGASVTLNLRDQLKPFAAKVTN